VIGGLGPVLRVSETRRPCCIHCENLRVSGIEPQGRVEFCSAGSKVSLHCQGKGELRVGHRVARVDLDRASRRGERRRLASVGSAP
jgi:hypothetical protein